MVSSADMMEHRPGMVFQTGASVQNQVGIAHRATPTPSESGLMAAPGFSRSPPINAADARKGFSWFTRNWFV
jgi:hypothetical protein